MTSDQQSGVLNWDFRLQLTAQFKGWRLQDVKFAHISVKCNKATSSSTISGLHRQKYIVVYELHDALNCSV